MRSENGLRWALESGETVFGAGSGTFSPTVIELFGKIGLDYVWLDFEHAGPSPYDSTVFEDLTRAAEAADIELLVRLPKPDPALIRKVLDAGVRTILLPRIETASELRRGVKAAYFSYEGGVGDRGVGVGRSSEWSGYVNDYVEGEDEEVLVGTMIENQHAVENIDEILAVPNLGFAFVGPADLSISLSKGDIADDTDEAVSRAMERTRIACQDASVPIGCIQNDVNAVQEAIDDGYKLVRIGGDLSAIYETLNSRIEALNS